MQALGASVLVGHPGVLEVFVVAALSWKGAPAALAEPRKAFRLIRVTRMLKTVQLVRVFRYVIALRTAEPYVQKPTKSHLFRNIPYFNSLGPPPPSLTVKPC